MTTFYHLTRGNIIVSATTDQITLWTKGFGDERTIHIPEEDFCEFRRIVEDATSTVVLPGHQEGINAAAEYLAECNGEADPDKCLLTAAAAINTYLGFMERNTTELVHGDIPLFASDGRIYADASRKNVPDTVVEEGLRTATDALASGVDYRLNEEQQHENP